jgi:hypothetical protein
MSALGVVLLVVGIVALNAACWAVIIVWMRKRMTLRRAQLREKLGPNPVIDAETATYRGATARFGKVKGLGVIGLTERRLVFARAVGQPLEIDRSEIVGVREDKWFLRSYTSGIRHLILQLRDGTEVGFFVRELGRWTEALGFGSSQPPGSV